ncbi:MAG TPA: hypothetical protein VLW50_01975 [Streptosporangiaceae bacterium]|nr:hypothetical protein [Streptosporangiaceae bacterium]
MAGGFYVIARNRQLLLWLIGTAGCWALLDFAYYGNTISSPEILKLINPHGSLLDNTLLQLGIFAVFALPGYALAILLLDKTGRKTIQATGFAIMALPAHWPRPWRDDDRRPVCAPVRDQLLPRAPVRAPIRAATSHWSLRHDGGVTVLGGPRGTARRGYDAA